jgi:hypothetical protein
MHHFSLVVHDKLGKVPWDNIGLAGFGVVELAVVSQVHEQWMRVSAVDLDLFEDGELGVEVFVHELLDLLGRPALLTEELVAGEGQNFESLGIKFLVHLDHGLVVGGCQSSLACYVDNHNSLFVLKN